MIQRYEFYEDGMMIKQADGEYVKYEDHIETVSKLEKEMSAIRVGEAEAFMLMEQAERKYVEANEQREKLLAFAKDLYFLSMEDVAFNPHWRAEKHGVLELLTKDEKTT